MIGFICPVCGGELQDCSAAYKCDLGHSYDKSKFGYVNLLLSQKSSAKRHGDDRVMVKARRDFLDAGYYSFLLEALCEICSELLPDSAAVLDAGCGEGYYSAGIKNALENQGKNVNFIGVDISKDALEFASKRKSGIPAAVASVFNLPVAGGMFDLVLNVFAPQADSEFHRILKSGGYLIRVIPLEKHLFDLKAFIYDKPYENEIADENIEGFRLLQKHDLRRTIKLGSACDIENLFKMTPYYYKTGRDDQQKIGLLESFDTSVEFGIRVYGKDG